MKILWQVSFRPLNQSKSNDSVQSAFLDNIKNFDADRAALKIKEHIFQIENFILWHYHFGSKYDTPFWDYAKTLTLEDPQFHKVLNNTLSAGDEWFSEKNNTTQYGQWKPFNFRYWYDGVV